MTLKCLHHGILSTRNIAFNASVLCHIRITVLAFNLLLFILKSGSHISARSRPHSSPYVPSIYSRLSFASFSIPVHQLLYLFLLITVHLSISFDAWLFSEASFVPNCLQSFLNDFKQLSPQPIHTHTPPQQTAHIWMHLRSLDWEFTGEQAVNSSTPLFVSF